VVWVAGALVVVALETLPLVVVADAGDGEGAAADDR